MQCAPPVGVKDPVEGEREDEEGDEVKNFVVDIGLKLERAEARVAGGEEEQEEDSCNLLSATDRARWNFDSGGVTYLRKGALFSSRTVGLSVCLGGGRGGDHYDCN